MATLTEAAIFSKRASRWVTLGLVGLILLLALFLGGKAAKTSLFPPKSLPAGVAFGKLPPMVSGGIRVPSTITFRLETVTGNLPILPKLAKVFAIEKKESSFGLLEKVRRMAAGVGFGTEPQEITPGKLRFVDPRDEKRVLTIETISGNFTFDSNYLDNLEIIGGRPKSTEDAIGKARNFLGNFGVDFGEFSKVKTRYMQISGGRLLETSSLSSANLVQVSFGRADLDGLRVIRPKQDLPGVSALVSEREVVTATSTISPIQKYKFATYPLKDVALAYEELKAGKAAANRMVNTSEVIITDVKLGYVESLANQFLEPVYMFVGLDNIIFYVPAVDDVWIESTPPMPPILPTR